MLLIPWSCECAEHSSGTGAQSKDQHAMRLKNAFLIISCELLEPFLRTFDVEYFLFCVYLYLSGAVPSIQ